MGLLKKCNEVIEATSIGIDRFWGLLYLAQKEYPLSCMLLGGNTRIELPSYLIHVEELLGTRRHALQDDEDGMRDICSMRIYLRRTHDEKEKELCVNRSK